MCKDFKKNMKENILVLTVCLITLAFSPVLYRYRNDKEKYALTSFIQNILVALFTFFVVFKVFCFCKKEEKKVEEPKKNANDPIVAGNQLYYLLSKSSSLIEGLKKSSSEGNEKANELIKNIKREGQNLVNSI